MVDGSALRMKSGAVPEVTVKDKLVEWLATPPEALIVIVFVPIVAVAVAEKETVTVHVGLHGLFVNAAVTPDGNPDAKKVTETVVPEVSVAVIEEDGLSEPRTTMRVSGEGVERLKSNREVTLTVSVPSLSPCVESPE